jgi:hypothetical protein
MKKKRCIVSMLLSAVAPTVLLIGCGSDTTSTPKATTQEITTVAESETTVETETTEMQSTEAETVKAPATEASTTTQNKNDTSALDFYKSFEENGVVNYNLNHAATKFFREHAELFPTDNVMNINDDFIDYVSTYNDISKSPDKFGDKLIYVIALDVVQIKEENSSHGRFTWLNVSDAENNYYTVFYRGVLPDISKGNTVNILGLPLGTSSYENTRGGTTLTLVLAGSNISLFGSSASNVPISNGIDNTPQTVASQNISEYILPDSATKYYEMDDVNWLRTDEVRLAINEIYARHGRMFKSEDLQNYFNSKSWYHPTIPADQFDDSILNDCERHNIEVLQILK